MKNKKGLRILLAAAAVILVATVAYTWAFASTAVEVTRASIGNIQESINIRGRVELEHRQKVYSKLPAFVRGISAAEGDRVSADFKLAELEAEDMDIVNKNAGIDLDISKEDVRNLASVVLPDLEKAYNWQKNNYERIRQSYEANSVSLTEYEAARVQLLEAEMALQDGKYQLKIARQRVAQAELQLEDARKNLGKVRIMSGMDGVILNKYVDENCAVQPGTPLFEIGDTDSAYVHVDILAQDAVRLKIGQKAVISGEAAGGRPVEGQVRYIAPKADTKISSLGVEQQRVEVRIGFDNALLSQKPGYDVEVEIYTKSGSVLKVPEESVFDSEGKDSVFIVKDGGLEIRSIETGIEGNRWIEVVKGLTEGDFVVSSLKNDLRPGQKVKIDYSQSTKQSE